MKLIIVIKKTQSTNNHNNSSYHHLLYYPEIILDQYKKLKQCNHKISFKTNSIKKIKTSLPQEIIPIDKIKNKSDPMINNLNILTDSLNYIIRNLKNMIRNSPY